jgi:hypothetical protein
MVKKGDQDTVKKAEEALRPVKERELRKKKKAPAKWLVIDCKNHRLMLPQVLEQGMYAVESFLIEFLYIP